MSTINNDIRIPRRPAHDALEADAKKAQAQDPDDAPSTTMLPAVQSVRVVQHVSTAATHAATATTARTTASTVAPERTRWNTQTAASARSFSENANLALRGTSSLSADDLSAAFFKLNALDPNDSVATQMNLISAQAELARLAIKQAKEQMAHATHQGSKNTFRDLFAKSLLAADPGLVKVQEYMVKKGWMSKDFMAYHIKFAREQEEKAKGGNETDPQEAEAARQTMAAAIDMLKSCNKRMQNLLARTADYARDQNNLDQASIDGVAMPKLRSAATTAMSAIYQQLGAIQASEGNAAAVAKCEDIARAEFDKAFRAAGMQHPEDLTEFMTANVLLDVSAAGDDLDTAVATGRALSDLGALFDNGDAATSFTNATDDIAALAANDESDDRRGLRRA